MNLYEITNGWMGESYLRCYAWAENAARALDLARQAGMQDELHYEVVLRSSDGEFCTSPDDTGWMRE